MLIKAGERRNKNPGKICGGCVSEIGRKYNSPLDKAQQWVAQSYLICLRTSRTMEAEYGNREED
jgi:hypothetical protein